MPAKKNGLSFADLSKKVDQPDPWPVEVTPGVWVTFHDPYSGSYDEDDPIAKAESPREQMQILLGDDGFAEFEKKSGGLDKRTYVVVIQSVLEHFKLGEDNASQR